MSGTVLFQTIQFSIRTLFSSIIPKDRTLSGATTLTQSEPGSDGNEGILLIPQSCKITRTSRLDCLSRTLVVCVWRGVHPSTEKQSVYSTAPAD